MIIALQNTFMLCFFVAKMSFLAKEPGSEKQKICYQAALQVTITCPTPVLNAGSVYWQSPARQCIRFSECSHYHPSV